MKVFISQPMHALTDQDIIENREIIISYFKNELYHGEEEVEFISTIDDEYNKNLKEEDIKGNSRIFYLGHAIQRLAEADMVVFAPDYNKAKGCMVERYVCELYKIPYKIIGAEENDN